MNKYSDDVATWLLDLNFTTCFFVAGGNIMHLIESFSKEIRMVPVIHEVAAVIAADYFNEASSADHFTNGKAFALVTAGPGVTNTVTGVSGAFIDSRELVILGGQVKSTDLKNSAERQRGIQEIDGVGLLSTVTKKSIRIDRRMDETCFKEIVSLAGLARKGPVFLEICLDIQGSASTPLEDRENFKFEESSKIIPSIKDNKKLIEDVLEAINLSERPVFLIGGGFPRGEEQLIETIKSTMIPIATTWHGSDRVGADYVRYAGRPNMFGQRWANIVIQQADLIIVLGSSLGVQQTGFNLVEFAPLSKILQVDVDLTSMKSDHLKNLVPVHSSIEDFIKILIQSCAPLIESKKVIWDSWNQDIQKIRRKLPLVEKSTEEFQEFINPFNFIKFLSSIAPNDLNLIPCSSGGSYTSTMQVFEQREGNLIVSSRGLGSMGIGLSGAIGVAVANKKLTWLIEGDGGVLQNIQELATISIQRLPIKIVIFANNGYASIRKTQNKYFKANYVGCDVATGLGSPDFELLAKSFGLHYLTFASGGDYANLERDLLSLEPVLIYVEISPDQQFIPKIESRLNRNGSMQSNPLHLMAPELDKDVLSEVMRFNLEGRQ
jgi:acetolactate synthase-1/2/3 large subunit